MVLGQEPQAGRKRCLPEELCRHKRLHCRQVSRTFLFLFSTAEIRLPKRQLSCSWYFIQVVDLYTLYTLRSANHCQGLSVRLNT